MSTMARHLLPARARICALSQPTLGRCNLSHTRPFPARTFPSSVHQIRVASSAALMSSPASSTSSSQSSSPLSVFSLQLPQLSPSMTHGVITAFHVQPGSTVTPASLVFSLTTSSLLAPASSSTVGRHAMLVESHDPGVVGWLDCGAVDSGSEVAVGRVVGWMWEDEDEQRKGEGRQDEVHRAVHEAAKSEGAGNGGATEVNGIRVKPFVWQAYVDEGERQEGECAPSRKE